MIVEVILRDLVSVIIVLGISEPVRDFLEVCHVLKDRLVLFLRGKNMGRNASGCIFEAFYIVKRLRFLVILGNGCAQQLVVHLFEPFLAHKQFRLFEILVAFVVYGIWVVLGSEGQHGARDAAQGKEYDGYSFTHNLQIYAKKFFSVKKMCTFAVLSRV